MPVKRQRLAERPETILEAADAVLRKGGARALTIDAVAAQAGLSKGGVLHHYASKDALILALVHRKLRDLRDGMAACEADLPAGPERLPLSMVAHARATYCDDDEAARALLLAGIENSQALTDYRAFVADRLGLLEPADGRAGGDGSVVFFAILGLMMGRALGFHDLSTGELDPMFAALERLARRMRT